MSKASSSVAKRTARRASDAVGTAAELAGGLVGTASQSAAATAAKGAVVAGAVKAASGAKAVGSAAGSKATGAAHAAQTAAAARTARASEAVAEQREARLPLLDRQAVVDQMGQVGQSTWDGTRALSEALREGALAAPAVDPRLVEAAAKVRDDITPRVAAALMTALESSRPNREEALRRASAAVAALRGEAPSSEREDAAPESASAKAAAAKAAAAGSRASSSRADESSGGRGKRVLLILLVVGAIAAVAKAVLARRAEQDAAEIWQTGEGFSAGSVPAAHDEHYEETVAGTPLLPGESGSSDLPAMSADAGGAGPDEAVADLNDDDIVATADVTATTDVTDVTGTVDTTDLAGPLGEGQVDLRDGESKGRHSRG